MLRNIQNGKEFSREMNESMKKLGNLLGNKLPEEVGHKLQKLVDESFSKEQYQDKRSPKWKQRKGDKEGALDRSSRRALLLKSGYLIKSAEVEVNGNEISVGSDAPYAQTHNEGLKSGKGAGFIMPQRQFMPIPGEANTQLDNEVERFLDKEMDKIFE